MSTYERGAQDISQHKETYARVMNITIWSAGLLGVSTLFLSMVFGGGMDWFPALAISLIVAILVGMLLKRGAAWHGTMAGLAVATWIISLAVSFLAGLV